MFPEIIFHSFPPLSLREKTDMLGYSARSVGRDSTLGNLSGAENSPSWVRDISFGEENKGGYWHMGTDSTKAKQSRFTRAWGGMPRISLEALVCADTKASGLEVKLPSYYFQRKQEKSNTHKPEEQDLKGSQTWTQNLCCLVSDILRAHAVLLQCQVTVFPWGRCWGGL